MTTMMTVLIVPKVLGISNAGSLSLSGIHVCCLTMMWVEGREELQPGLSWVVHHFIQFTDQKQIYAFQ